MKNTRVQDLAPCSQKWSQTWSRTWSGVGEGWCSGLVEEGKVIYPHDTIHQIGASYNGSTTVSKTVSVGSIPPAPARQKTRDTFPCFLHLCSRFRRVLADRNRV